MLFKPATGTVQVLGSGLWNAESPEFGSYVDVYDADEGAVDRWTVEKTAGPAPQEGDVIEPLVSSRTQSKARSVGNGDTREAIVVEKTQLRLRAYRVVGRMRIEAAADAEPPLAEVA